MNNIHRIAFALVMACLTADGRAKIHADPKDVRLTRIVSKLYVDSTWVEWVTCAGSGDNSRRIGMFHVYTSADETSKLLAQYRTALIGNVHVANQVYQRLISLPGIWSTEWNIVNPPIANTRQCYGMPDGSLFVQMAVRGGPISGWSTDDSWAPDVACTVVAPSVQDLGTLPGGQIGGRRYLLAASVSCDGDTDVAVTFKSTAGTGVVDFGDGLVGKLTVGSTPVDRWVMSMKANVPRDPVSTVEFTRYGGSGGKYTGRGVLTVEIL